MVSGRTEWTAHWRGRPLMPAHVPTGNCYTHGPSVWKKPDVPMRQMPRVGGLRRWERTVLEHVRLNPQPEMRLVAMVIWETRRDIVDGASDKARAEALAWVAVKGSGWWTFDDLCTECGVDCDVVREDLLTREPRVRTA